MDLSLDNKLELTVLDKMSVEDIHAIERPYDDDYETHRRISEYFLTSSRFNDEQRYHQLFIEAKQYGNPCAAEILANCYRDGIYFEQSDKLYYEMLEQFEDNASQRGNYSRIAKDLFDENYSGPAFGSLTTNDWLHLCDLGKASELLGLYYAGFQDIEHLTKAEGYLRQAFWCHIDCRELLKTVDNKIGILKSGDSRFAEIKMPFASLYPPNLSETAQCELFVNTNNLIKQEMSEIYWSKLQKETQVYLHTAVFTFVQFLSVGEKLYLKFDYSGVISLLMRALEYELENRFLKGYLEFLETQYPNVDSYLKQNNISNWKHRKFILKEDFGTVTYQLYDESNTDSHYFTMGIMPGLIGYRKAYDFRTATIDFTVTQYLQRTMKHESNEKDIINWITNILDNVSLLRSMRNRAAHGGEVLNANAAMEALNILVLVKKVLKDLVVHF